MKEIMRGRISAIAFSKEIKGTVYINRKPD